MEKDSDESIYSLSKNFLADFFFPFTSHLRLMEILRLGVKLEMQLQAYATATASGSKPPSVTHAAACSKAQVLNPLSEARDRTCILAETVSSS